MKDENPKGVPRSFQYRPPRFAANFPVAISLEFGARRIGAKCCDISDTGLAVELVHEELQPGTEVSMLLTSPDSSVSLTLQARLEYRAARRHGFVFLFNSDHERHLVHLLVRACYEQSSE